MNHLTDEQFENIMQGEKVRPMHLKSCIECRTRLTEREALASRLRLAFAGIKPEEGLVERIRRQSNIGLRRIKHTGERHLLKIRFRRRSWLSIASAAAVLIIVIPLAYYVAEPSAAVAAQAELVRIHEDNLSASHEFHDQNDPQKIVEYFKSKLGVSLIMPRAGQGRSLRGCCVCRFRGQIVGSYVVETPQGLMSVVVVTDQPQSLGMDRKFQLGERTFWAGSFAGCKLVTVRIGQYSYCAVGKVPEAHLAELLVGLIPHPQS
jgi:hypothetical protein